MASVLLNLNFENAKVCGYWLMVNFSIDLGEGDKRGRIKVKFIKVVETTKDLY